MGEFKVNIPGTKSVCDTLSQLQKQLLQSQDQINGVKNRLSSSSMAAVRISLGYQAEQVGSEAGTLLNMYQKLEEICQLYVNSEEQIKSGKPGQEGMDFRKGAASSGAKTEGVAAGTDKGFIGDFWSNYGWKGLLSGSNYIGKVYGLVKGIKDGKTWRDFAKAGVDTYQFLSGAAKTYKNYKKIGNAVGTKTAMAWWAKNITGLKPLGRASTAKNPITRFKNNLTNKTSPFHAQFKNVIDNFKGANGVKKAVASWAAVAANFALNWSANKEEQANSNGTMSTGRVVAETITETAIDTALTYGAGIVVGAAVTTVLGPVAVPGILVTAASGAIIAGINTGVKALTGKSTTEWLSDTILDTGVKIGNAVSNVSKSIGNWFTRLSFA